MITLTVDGKNYLVCPPQAYNTRAHGIIVTYGYWSTRNGEKFGPWRIATRGKGKGVGAKLVALADEAFGTDYDAMIAAVRES